MKGVGMLFVLLSGVNFRFWSHFNRDYNVFSQGKMQLFVTHNYVAMRVLFMVAGEKNRKSGILFNMF